jgi:transposase
MGAPVPLREDYSADELRRWAGRAAAPEQARRLLALAAVREGMSRAAAARLGGMDRQTLRDWVHAFNAHGPDGLINGTSPGRPPKLSAAQKQAVSRIVETGPDPKTDGVVRWRCVDLRGIIKERYGVDLDEVSVGRLLKELGFAHMSARPRHPKQDKAAIAAFKKTSPPAWRRS